MLVSGTSGMNSVIQPVRASPILMPLSYPGLFAYSFPDVVRPLEGPNASGLGDADVPSTT